MGHHHSTSQGNQTSEYGVLVGKIKDGREFTRGQSPHYEIWVTTDEQSDANYRIAVNVESNDNTDDLA